MLNYIPRQEDKYVWDTILLSLDLGTWRRWIVRIKPPEFYSWGRISRWHIGRDTVLVSELIWKLWRREKFLVPAGNWTRFLTCPSNSLVTIISQLRPCCSSAVRRWLPTAAARVRVRAACGVCGGQTGTGAGFLRVLRFPLPITPPISPLS
jgi:hypothetical protein